MADLDGMLRVRVRSGTKEALGRAASGSWPPSTVGELVRAILEGWVAEHPELCGEE